MFRESRVLNIRRNPNLRKHPNFFQFCTLFIFQLARYLANMNDNIFNIQTLIIYFLCFSPITGNALEDAKLWMFIDGKAIEILTYFVILFIYIRIKLFIKTKVCLMHTILIFCFLNHYTNKTSKAGFSIGSIFQSFTFSENVLLGVTDVTKYVRIQKYVLYFEIF